MLFKSFKAKFSLLALLTLAELREIYFRTFLIFCWEPIKFNLLIFLKLAIFGSPNDVLWQSKLLSFFLMWTFISRIVISGTSITGGVDRNLLKLPPIKVNFIVAKVISLNLFIFWLNLFSAALLFSIFFNNLTLLDVIKLFVVITTILMLVSPIIFLVTVYLTSISIDIAHAIRALIPILFFATPIIWTPPETGLLYILSNINPIYFLMIGCMELVFQNTISMTSLIVIISFAFMSVIVMLNCNHHKKLMNWLLK